MGMAMPRRRYVCRVKREIGVVRAVCHEIHLVAKRCAEHVNRGGVIGARWSPESKCVVRAFSFSRERDGLRYARQLTCVSALELQFEICRYSLEETQQRRGEIRCAEPPHPQRLRIPHTLVAGRMP